MAREVTTTVYKFEELSDDAKERARYWWRNASSNDDWWSCAYDDLAKTMEIIGIAFEYRTYRTMGGDTGKAPDFYFSIDRDYYFNFCGFYSYDKGWKEKAKAEYGKDIFCPEKATGRLAEFLQAWDKMQHDIQKPTFYGLNCRIGRASYHNGLSLEGLCVTTTGYENYATDKQGEQLAELLGLFTGYAVQRLQDEYDGINSDEYIDDTLIANEYEFTEQGDRA